MSKANPLEWQMLDLINAERATYDLDPLQLELRLNTATEDHSDWMIDTDTFSHTGVSNSTPWDRMEDAGFVFRGTWSAAENIAWQSVRGAAGLSDDVLGLHNSLMNSPGHRANILSDTAEVIGIGIERGEYNGWDGLFVTQAFARTGAPVQLDTRASSDPVLQVGVETVDQLDPIEWHKIDFDQTIDNAVVVMGPVSSNGADPVAVRVRNVTDDGFEFRMEEWEYDDGRHVSEKISWMAVSEGTHQLADGRTIIAGIDETDHNMSRVGLGNAFDDKPLVFAQVASNNGADTVVTRLANIADDHFNFRLQEEEARGTHIDEDINWIAIDAGTTSEAIRGVTHQGTQVTHRTNDALFAQLQTFNGSDTANIRYDQNGGQSRIWVDEENSADAEITHNGETVAVLTLGTGSFDLIA